MHRRRAVPSRLDSDADGDTHADADGDPAASPNAQLSCRGAGPPVALLGLFRDFSGRRNKALSLA
jgi:hypothetical protein